MYNLHSICILFHKNIFPQANNMKTVIIAENIVECGCSNIIHKALASVNGVYGVKVSPEKKMILIDHTDETTDEKLINKLKKWVTT